MTQQFAWLSEKANFERCDEVSALRYFSFSGVSHSVFFVYVAGHFQCLGFRGYFLEFVDNIWHSLLRSGDFSPNKRRICGGEVHNISDQHGIDDLALRNFVPLLVLEFVELWDFPVLSA